MEQITMTINYTSLEDSMLLVNGGIPVETADMMYELLEEREPKIYLSYDKRQADYYPKYYKPCWSERKLRTMIRELGTRTEMKEIDSLVPTLLCLYTMKELKEKKGK